MTLRQISGIYTAEGVNFTTAATLSATSGVLRFSCALRVCRRNDRRLMLVTQSAGEDRLGFPRSG